VPVLYYLQSAFTIWMLVDCVRSRRDAYWYLIAFVPFGPLVYFLAVKLDDYDTRWFRRLFVRAPSIEALRYALRQTPSFANRVGLAEALREKGEYQEAETLFEQALKSDKKDRVTLHGLGLCRLARDDVEGAIDVLTMLMDIDLPFRDYAAALDLVSALQQAKRSDEAIEVLEVVCRRNTALAHRVTLARLLVDLERPDEARKLLEGSIEDTRHAPSYLRRRDRAARREAAALLDQITRHEAEAAGAPETVETTDG
jgi:hypothetical protein